MGQAILIATTNAGKLREIRAVMGGLPFDWSSLADMPEIAAPIEDKETFAENALLKARYYASQTRMWVLADDSGLEVDALDGKPGVHSARFCDEGTDAGNNRKLVAELKAVPQEKRTARFVCSLVLVRGDDVLLTARGTIEGVIIDEPRGSNGFGYDPHFLVPTLGMTTAEMQPEQKNALSHRGRALATIREDLIAMHTSQT